MNGKFSLIPKLLWTGPFFWGTEPKLFGMDQIDLCPKKFGEVAKKLDWSKTNLDQTKNHFGPIEGPEIDFFFTSPGSTIQSLAF